MKNSYEKYGLSVKPLQEHVHSYPGKYRTELSVGRA